MTDKNLTVYRLNPDWSADLAAAEEALAKARFTPCSPSQPLSVGWVAPRGRPHDPLVESVGGQWLVKLMVEQKVLPASVIKRRVEEMSAVLERVRASDETTRRRTIVPLPVRLRLGHAAVQHVADRCGTDILHIKGGALADSLIHPGRTTTDVDVLVRPEHIDTLLRALLAEGFTRKGRFATSSPFEHSVTLFHRLWGHIDVHRLYPGIDLPPERAFERLWRGRAMATIGGRPCPVPEVPVQALMLILHAARNPPNGQPSRDVEHVWTRADEDSRRAIEAVVEELGAQVPFATATGTAGALPPSAERDLWQAVAHPDGRVREWRARIAAAPGVGARLRLIARLPLVNTDHLASRLGHRPNKREIAAEFFDRGRRALLEQRRRS